MVEAPIWIIDIDLFDYYLTLLLIGTLEINPILNLLEKWFFVVLLVFKLIENS